MSMDLAVFAFVLYSAQELQVQYVLACLRHLKRHHASALKQGVVLVGHSMGGIVARAAAVRAETDADLGRLVGGPFGWMGSSMGDMRAGA